MFCNHGDHSLVQRMQAVPLTASHWRVSLIHTHTCRGQTDDRVYYVRVSGCPPDVRVCAFIHVRVCMCVYVQGMSEVTE